MDEKALPTTPRARFDVVGFFLAGIRLWQWSSSFFVYASVSLLHAHAQWKDTLGANSRMKAVEILGLVSLLYTTLVICAVHISKTLGLRSWRVAAMLSLPGDVTSMGLCIATITILSLAGLPADCHGFTRDNYDGNDLVRQPADGYGTTHFGSWAASVTGELDRWCAFPRTVYGLSVLAIFSYTFTLLLSVLHLQHHKRAVLDNENLPAHHPNSPRPTLRHIGMHMASSLHTPSLLDLDIPFSPSSPVLSAHHSMMEMAHSRASSPHTRSRAPSTSSSWGGITLHTNSSSDTDSVHSGGSLPPAPVPGSSQPPRRRWSTSTSSSFNANAFLVADGFRPAMMATGEEGQPPVYESRPGSLYHETVKYPAALGLPGMPKP